MGSASVRKLIMGTKWDGDACSNRRGRGPVLVTQAKEAFAFTNAVVATPKHRIPFACCFFLLCVSHEKSISVQRKAKESRFGGLLFSPFLGSMT